MRDYANKGVSYYGSKMRLRPTLLFLLVTAVSAQQTSTNLITRFAGTDLSIAGGVEAFSVPLPPGPWGKPAVDAAGNIYFSLTSQHVVLKLTPAGRLERFAGNGFARFAGDGGRAATASLNSPRDIAIDSRGIVYIADNGNKRIRRVLPTGVIDTLAGGGRLTPSSEDTAATDVSLPMPWAIAVDGSDNVYFTIDEFSVARLDYGASQLRLYAGTPGTGGAPQAGPIANARFRFLTSLAADKGGNLYLADPQSFAVLRITSTGRLEAVTTRASTTGAPVDVAVDAGGALYLAQTGSAVIWRVRSGGGVEVFSGDAAREGFTPSGTPREGARFGEELRLALDARGNVIVGDRRNGLLRRVSAVVDTLAGSDQIYSGEGNPAVAAVFFAPSYLARGRTGTTYFSDSSARIVFSIDSNGTLRRFAGSGILNGTFTEGRAALEAAFGTPQGLAVDSSGNVYVADDDCSIRRIGTDGAMRLHAGVPGLCGSSRDGVSVREARFGRLRGLAIDGSGNLLVSDITNHKIWRLSADGSVRTLAGTGTAGTSTAALPGVQTPLDNPAAVAVGADGAVYIADFANNRVLRVGPEGRATIIAGTGQRASSGDNGPALSAALHLPAGIAVDDAGNIFIAEQGGNRVRRIDSSGIIRPYAGTGTAGARGDGGPAITAQLAGPTGLLLTPSGELLIVDRDNGRIRRVLSGAPAIRIPTTQVSIAPSPGQFTGRGTIALPSPIAGLAFEAAVRSAPWMRVTPLRGTLPAVLTYETNSAGLAAGDYTGQIVVTVAAGAPRETVIPVTLRVPAPPTRPFLVSGNARLTLSAVRGGTAQQSVPISNPGAAPITVRGAVTRGAFMSVDPAEITIPPGQTGSFNVTADAGTMAIGTYSGITTYTAGTTSYAVNVSFNVSAARSRLILSQNGLSFRAVADGATPPAQVLYAAPAERLAVEAATLIGAPWLSASATGNQVSVSVNPQGLAAGDYYGRVAVFDSATPAVRRFATVLLQVLPAGSDPGPEVYPSALLYTATVGGEVPGQDVELTLPTKRRATFSATGATFEGQPWLEFFPAGGGVVGDAPARITVQPDLTGLPAGVFRGSVTLELDDGETRAVSILAVISPSATANAKNGNRNASGCSNPDLFPQALSPAANFRVTVGEPMRLAVRVVDGCGNAHQPESGGNAGVAVTGFGSQVVNLTHVGGGVWEGTATPSTTQAAATVTFLGLYSRGTFLQAGAERVNGAVVTSQRPVIFNDSLTDAASFQFGVPVAPGTLVSVFGTNLNAANAVPSSLPLPLRLDEVEVRLNDQPIPLLFAGPGQVNAQIPYALEPDGEYQLEIRRGGAIVTPQPVVISQARPGIFSVDQSGQGQGHIYRALPDGSQQLANAAGAATAGEVLVVYCNGLGMTNPSVTAGAAAPFSPLAVTTNPVTLTIGGQSAPILFAGLAPGFTGLYQVNAQVPAGVAAGAAVPVILTVAGQSSVPVEMGVR